MITTNTPIIASTNTADARSLMWTACSETDGATTGAPGLGLAITGATAAGAGR